MFSTVNHCEKEITNFKPSFNVKLEKDLSTCERRRLNRINHENKGTCSSGTSTMDNCQKNRDEHETDWRVNS
jgi:hypothetical protein